MKTQSIKARHLRGGDVLVMFSAEGEVIPLYVIAASGVGHVTKIAVTVELEPAPGLACSRADARIELDLGEDVTIQERG